MKNITILLGALILMAAGAAFAQTAQNTPASTSAAAAAPDALVKTTVDDVMRAIKTAKDKRALQEVAEKTVVQHFDFQAMTRLAVGKYWREATPAQQKSLEDAFRALLVTTYTTALSHSPKVDHAVEVRPLQLKPTDDDVTVRTLVREPGQKPIEINYRMAKSASGWKVYDVVVENLSLVTNYRGSFNSEITRNGIDGLIKSLEAKNRQNAQS